MIILVSGYRRAGKDFFATHGPGYYSIYPNEFRNLNPLILNSVTEANKLKFATPLARLVPIYFNVSSEQYDSLKDDPQAIEDNGTIRDYLIAIAKSVRELDDDFFVRRTAEDIKSINSFGSNVVITDWRYLNEYFFLEKMFPGQVVTVRIVRYFDGRKTFQIPDPSITSEHALDDFDFDFVLHAYS